MTASPSARRLILLRHGRTAWNLTGRAQGQTDVPLDDVGRAQAAAAAAALAKLHPVRLISSDLGRARQTAEAVAAATGLSITLDPRLREFDVGVRAGLTTEEFAARFPDEHEAWRAGDLGGLVADAETTEQVLERMTPALRELLEVTAPGETSVAVSHGASLKATALDLLGIDRAASALVAGLDNACWAVLEDAGDGRGLRLTAWNRIAPDAPCSADPRAEFASPAPVG